MKALKYLIFVFFFYLVSAPLFAKEWTTVKVLDELNTTNVIVNDLNLSALRSIRKCLYDSGTYKNSYLDMLGNIIDIEEVCDIALKQLIFDPIKNDLENMRINLALSKPQIRDDNPFFAESLKGNHIFKWSNKLSHVAKGFNSIDLDDLTSEEIEIIKSEYRDSQIQICDAYINGTFKDDLKKLERLYQHRVDFKLREMICNDILNGNDAGELYEPKSVSSNFKNILILQEIAKIYYLKAARFRIKWRALKLQRYYNIISNHPFLIFLDINRKSRKSVLYSIDRILDNAEKRREDSVQSLEDKNKELNIRNLESLDQSISNVVLDYTRARLKENNSYNETFESAFDEIRKFHQHKEKVKTYWQMSFIIGGNVSCFLPVGKLFNLSKLSLGFRSTCFAALGLPVNTYFFMGAREKNKELWENFISTIDGEKYTNDYNVIHESKKILLLELLFLPIGIEATNILRQVKKLLAN